jgi:hypothetical protein
MNESDWNSLVYSLQTGNCILLLGPEVATGASESGAKPLSSLLANELSAELGYRAQVLDADDLAHVAQLYATAQSSFDLQVRAAEFYQRKSHQPCSIHLDLAALPFPLIVSATHDSLMQQARGPGGCVVDWYRFRGEKKDVAPTGSPTHPLVYYLYGSPREARSLVLSENDLLDFLVSIISQDPPLPSNIRSEFKSRDKCFVFLGFGFRQWYLRILLHVLQEDRRNSRSFAFEDIGSPDDPSLQHAIVYYKEKYKLGVYPILPAEFVRQLRSRYEQHVRELSEADAAVPGSVGGHAPVVFICHRNAPHDKTQAVRVGRALEEEGMRPWVDHDGLETGAEWDKVIRRTIATADYFVVLQSCALDRHEQGYVNEEIKRALKRQKAFRYPSRFIFPAEIEDCAGLQELRPWQSVRIDTDAGLKKLVREIKRDYQRRLRNRGAPPE